MRLKDDDLKKIASLVDKGYGTEYIAVKFSYNSQAMYRIIRRYKLHGLKGIMHNKSKSFSIDEKLGIINRHYSGESINSLAIEINVSYSVINQWIKKYEQLGYNGLKDNRGRPGVTNMGRPRKNKTQEQASYTKNIAQVNNAEREELNRLRKENFQLRMELACAKKLQALVQQRQNRQMKKK